MIARIRRRAWAVSSGSSAIASAMAQRYGHVSDTTTRLETARTRTFCRRSYQFGPPSLSHATEDAVLCGDAARGMSYAVSATRSGSPKTVSDVDTREYRMSTRALFLMVALTVICFVWGVPDAAASGYVQTNLTSDIPGLAANTDPNLKN